MMDFQKIIEQANRTLLAGMKAGQEIERQRKPAMIKAATILAAIDAMRAVDDMHFSGRATLAESSRAWNNLSAARDALQVELGALGVELERQTKEEA